MSQLDQLLTNTPPATAERLDKCHINDDFELSQLYPGVYFLSTTSRHLLAYTFLRAQEYHESPNENFNFKSFKKQDYINWYSKTQSKNKTFSYATDWSGFNLPSRSLLACYEKADPSDFDAYDHLMLKIIKHCEQSQVGDFYLIGANPSRADVLSHEIAHALFSVNKEYKDEMMENINSLPLHIKQKMNQHLHHQGYSPSVFCDETQAYFATGLTDSMKDMQEYCGKFTRTFASFSSLLAATDSKNIKSAKDFVENQNSNNKKENKPF